MEFGLPKSVQVVSSVSDIDGNVSIDSKKNITCDSPKNSSSPRSPNLCSPQKVLMFNADASTIPAKLLTPDESGK